MRLAAPPLVPLAIFAALMHGAAALRLLPAPRPALDTDRTILIHQVEASRARQEAEVVLVGDSSCLMDISARQLGQSLGRPVLNLGTLSYLDLNAYALLVREYARANPGRLREVVLLMHPEALRRASPEPYYVQTLQALLNHEMAQTDHNMHETVAGILGLARFRDCCLARLLPVPLGGVFGRRYGFNRELENYLTLNGGSLVEPEAKPFGGNAEYRLAGPLERASRAFKAAVPAGCRLIAGITPAPAGFVQPNYAQDYASMLRQWSQWLQADAALQGLPAVLPDAHFAKTTHLNRAGVAVYTTLLASNLVENTPRTQNSLFKEKRFSCWKYEPTPE